MARRRKSASWCPRRARPGEAAGVGDRALMRVAIDGEAGDAVRHSGRVIKLVDRAKQRVLGIFRALPGGGGRLSPVDKKQLGQGARHSAGRHRQAPGTATWSPSRCARQGGFGLPPRSVEGAPRLAQERARREPDRHPRPRHPARLSARRAGRGGSRAAGHASPAARTGARCRSSPSIRPTPRTTTTRSTPSPDTDPANPGGFIVTVAIADVAHYVRPGSALDREALRPRQLGLFPRPRRADAAGAHLQRSVLAAAGRGSRRARRAHGDRRRRPQALATRSIAC